MHLLLPLRRSLTVLALVATAATGAKAQLSQCPADTLAFPSEISIPGELKLICPVDRRANHPVIGSDDLLRHVVGLVDVTEVNNYNYYIIKAFDENAQHDPNDPGLPRFAIIGKENKYYLGIGGYVKATTSFDFGNPIPSASYFTTADIPTNLEPGNGALWQMSAATSCLYFNFVGLPQSVNRFGVYLGFNFTGAHYAPKLQAAYVSYRNLVFGYKYTLFFDGPATPPTIDHEGPCAAPAAVVMGGHIRWTRGPWSYAVGIEEPTLSATEGAQVTLVNQRVPAVPAFVQYSYADGDGSVRLSAIARMMQYRDLAANCNRGLTGWGVQLTGIAPLFNNTLELYYQGLYGQGIADLVQDMSGLGLDLVPSLRREGRMQLVPAWGATFGFGLHFSERCYSTHSYSQTRAYATRSLLANDGTDYRYAQYVANNLFFHLADNVRVGGEYLLGRLATTDGRHHVDHRLQAMLQVYF